ncbi:MAG TPA: lysylphosphatidylglycerol synthase transmembrane domain-containing protein [Acidimicrobiales bacterium]
MATRPSRRFAWVSTVLGTLIGILGLVFVVAKIAQGWNESSDAIADADWWWLAPAAVAAAAGMGWVGLGWRQCLEVLGVRAPRLDVLVWYFIGQMGKYIPGGVWPVVGRGEMATRAGVPRPAAYNSVALSMAITYLSATVAVLFLSPLYFTRSDASGEVLWLVAFLPLGLVLLHPAVLRRLLRVAERVLGDGSHPMVPRWRDTLRLIVVLLPAWAGIGTSTWMVARALDPSAPFVPVVLAGVFSWIVGFLAIPVPGGVGVREAAFVATAQSLSPGVAGATALVSRLIFMAVDAATAGLAAGPLRRRTSTRARAGHPVVVVSGTPSGGLATPPGGYPSGS